MILFDAGIFIGAILLDDPRHQEAYAIVEKARQGEILACTTVGILSEVYAALTWVAAKPPHSPQNAAQAVTRIVEAPSAVRILTENSVTTVPLMLNLAQNHRLTARRIHDARHAATALTSGVYQVYSYDVDDWQLFVTDGLRIVEPISVLPQLVA